MTETTEKLAKKLREEFPERPKEYSKTVAKGLQKNMAKFEANKEVFGDSALKEFEDLKLGHRFRFKNGLYEVIGITFETRHEEPHVTLAKVLDTKVSESRSNIIKVSLSKLRNSNPFDRYNKMADKAYDIVF